MRFILACFFAAISTGVFAKELTIRSGEHVDFSRLAFDFSSPVNWTMGRVDNGYEIRLESPLEKVDMTKVYQRISRDRISNIVLSENGSRITLLIDCECFADAFEFRPGLLVVDIKDGIASKNANFETTFTADETSTASMTDPETSKGKEKPEIVVTKAQAETERQFPLSVGQSKLMPRTKVGGFPGLGLPDVNSGSVAREPSGHLAQMQQEMLSQIGRAASQGLLDANIIDLPVDEKEQQQSENIELKVEEQQAPENHINMHISNSVDRGLKEALNKTFSTTDGSNCMPDEMFDIASWGDQSSVLKEISNQRAKVMGEFDKVDEQAVERLVKAYIFAGFGAEAKNVIDAFGITLKHGTLLRLMAEIVDGHHKPSVFIDDGQLACKTNAALWAALNLKVLPKGKEINRIAIISSFSHLPHHLRQLLGPVLSQKFLDAGDIETAQTLRDAIARTPGLTGAEFRLLDARLDQKRGLNESAEDALAQIVSEDNDVSPKALVELLQAKLSQNNKIENSFLETAEIIVFEQPNSKISADLQRLIILSRAKEGSFILALKALRVMKKIQRIDKEAKAEIWGKVLEYALAENFLEDMLVFVFSTQDELADYKISRDILRKISSRLLDEELIEIAQNILLVSGLPTADDQLLLARAAILDNKPEKALELLQHVSSTKAATLRARAYSAVGNHIAAAQEYVAVDEGEKHQKEIWRAKDWDKLAQSKSKPNRIAAKIMLEENSAKEKELPNNLGVISYNKALLEESVTTRRSLDMLLNEFPSLNQKSM